MSRTPLQKLATPEFTFSSSPVERIERFRSNIRSEPRSPVERLKDTVSKMCLYTGSPRGSDSTSPQPSPRKRSSLYDEVEVGLDKVKSGVTKKLDLGEYGRSGLAVDVQLVKGADEAYCLKQGQMQHTVVDRKTLDHDIKCCQEKQGSKETDINSTKAADLDHRTLSERTSLASSLSGETVIETDHQILPCSALSDTNTACLGPVSKVVFDLICPEIVESVHKAPFCAHNLKTNTSLPICPKTESINRPHPGSKEAISELAEEPGDAVTMLDACKSLPSSAYDGSQTKCSITVTGWEGEDVDLCHISAVKPIQTCEESLMKEKSQYLNPHQCRGLVSNNLPQVNSFELEEVK